MLCDCIVFTRIFCYNILNFYFAGLSRSKQGGRFHLKTPIKKYKILMTLMQMDIGGAETHVLELSRALAARGHEVWVASRGGVYVKNLEDAGVRHVSMPLNTKNPGAVYSCYKSLYKLISDEKFDIVHAHARIPAFICGLIRRRLDFKFVTTAHWVFKINPLWKVTANWGERTIAVSQDIKQYLIDNYGIFPDNISVTINGIDTEAFSRNTDFSDAAHEFGMKEGARRVVCVSRMDKSRGAVPVMLAELAPALIQKYPDIEIVLVGGNVLSSEAGELEKIREMAEKTNKAAGRPALIVTGSRTDINKFIASSTVFVGASRAALEAMSAQKPIILAGNEGYIGILDHDNLESAYKTNFCCRDCAAASKDLLLRDICDLLDSTPERLETLGRQNRDIILRDYSVVRMAEDYEHAYQEASLRNNDHGDIIISGYYGFNNVGDDSMLSAMIKNIHKQDPSLGLTVLSTRPKIISERYGVRSIKRTNILKIVSEMKDARLLISGGGSLLQNATSTKSLLYYTYIIKLAKQNGLRVMLYSNGIGPVYGQHSEDIVRNIISTADVVTLREPSSYSDLQKLGAKLSHTSVSADPALCIEPADSARIDYITQHIGFVKGKKYFAVSLRELSDIKLSKKDRLARKKFESVIVDAINTITERFDMYPVFIPMQQSKDMSICRRVHKRTSENGILINKLTASEIVGILGQTEFAIGMRLHILIYALNAGVPMIGLSYDPKINAFLEYASLPFALDIKSVTKDKILSLVSDILGNQAEIKNNMVIAQRNLYEHAIKDSVIAANEAKI